MPKYVADGVCAIIMNKGRILLLNRRNIPFLVRNPGIWSFLFGSMEKGEKPDETVYREIEEETRLRKKDLKLISNAEKMLLIDLHSRKRWYNYTYVFESKSRNVEINIENSAFRWASIEEVKEHKGYTNIFYNEKKILNLLREMDERQH